MSLSFHDWSFPAVRPLCTFVFIIATAKIISEHRPLNVVSQPGIEPETLQFQDNHEAHYAPEATFPDGEGLFDQFIRFNDAVNNLYKNYFPLKIKYLSIWRLTNPRIT